MILESAQNTHSSTILSLGNVRVAEGHDEAVIDFISELGYPEVSFTQRNVGGVACSRIEIFPPVERQHIEDIGQFCSELAAGRDHEIALGRSSVTVTVY